MDYCLDAGDGTASIWTGQLDIDVDGDGELDGLRLDFDGDGAFDDALADFDNDGLADHAAIDLDDDGVPEARFTDDGSGTWMVAGGEAPVPLRWFDLDRTEHVDPSDPIDVDGDGGTDLLFDVNRDGLADRALSKDLDGGVSRGYVDTDGDGDWDVVLTDLDGDGSADGAATV